MSESLYWVVLYMICDPLHHCEIFNYGSPFESFRRCEESQTYVYSTGHPQIVPAPDGMGYLTEECLPFQVDNGDYFRLAAMLTERWSKK